MLIDPEEIRRQMKRGFRRIERNQFNEALPEGVDGPIGELGSRAQRDSIREWGQTAIEVEGPVRNLDDFDAWTG